MPKPIKKLPKIVVSALVKKGDKYLLVKEKIEDKAYHYLVPGGKVDFGESLEEAVKRELKEETGLEIDELEFITHHEAIFPQFDYHTVIFFYLAKPITDKFLLEKKIKEANFYSAQELKNLKLVSSARWLLEKLAII